MERTTRPCGCMEPVTCLACDLPPFERNNYFCGKLMVERDFWADQLYHIGKQRLHTRFLHGWGTVCGLKVTAHPHCPDLRIIIEPGLAVDCCGREIFLRAQEELEIATLLETLPEHDREHPPTAFYVCVHYIECYTEEVPALFTECGCGESRCHPNRIRDGHRFSLLTEEQVIAQHQTAEARVGLHRAHVIPITGSYAVAVDEPTKRLYVLTQRLAANVLVYSTEDQLPIGATIAVGKDPSGFARASDLKRLYVATTYTRSDGTQISHAIVTLDTDKIGMPDVVKASVDIAGTEAGKGAIIVSPAGLPHRFVYAVRGNDIVAFRTSDLEADGVPAAAFNIAGLTSPAAMAATQDGQRLYIAERTPNTVAVVEIPASPSGSLSVKGRVQVADEPVSLVVGPDDAWVYVASRSGQTVSAIHRQTLEDEIDAGPTGDPAKAVTTLSLAQAASLPARTPADLTVSPSGLWLYVAADQGGHLLAIDARRLVNTALLATPTRAADRTKAVLDEVAILPNPTGVALGAAGGKLFAVSPGSATTAGGVAVVEVKEEPCEAIFDRALDPCPPCTGDECIVLARIERYEKDKAIQEDMIENDTPARRMLYSTEILSDVIKCMLEHCMLEHGGAGSMGPQGPEGPQGPQGPPGRNGQSVTDVNVTFVDRGDPHYPGGHAQYNPLTGLLELWIPKGPGITDVVTHFVGPGERGYPDGDASYDVSTGVLELWIPKGEKGEPGERGPKGDPGLGLDSTLTHIRAINWTHGQMNASTKTLPTGDIILGYIDMVDPSKPHKGFIVAFDKKVKFDTINHHTFLVSIRRIPPDTQNPQGRYWSARDPSLRVRPWQEVFISGDIEPVQVLGEKGCQITKVGEMGIPADRKVDAVRFRPVGDSVKLATTRDASIHIVLKGDFILDEKDRLIDSEHFHRLLPKGDAKPGLGPMQPGKPCASGDWVPGGDFESWIDITPE